MTVNIDKHVEVVLVQNTVVHVNSGNENYHLDNRTKRPHCIQNKNYLPKRPPFCCQNDTFNNYRLMHALFDIRTVIIPRDQNRPEGFSPRVDIDRGMITVLVWKKACIILCIAYFNIGIKSTKLISHRDTTLIWIWVIDISWGMITVLLWKKSCIDLFIERPDIVLSDFFPDFFFFSLNIFYLLKCAKRIRHKSNKLMKSSPIYNKLQHYLIEHACI
jgi:hypothetical protein